MKVVRKPGNEPITGVFYDYAEQEFEVDATSVQAALTMSHIVCTLPLRGQFVRTFINGEECFDERY